MDPSDMIRFVAGPDGTMVPDLKRNLPGRGVWVTAKKSCVEQAVSKSAFARGLKSKAKADPELPDLVENLLSEAALGALGFARKAGQCITGAGKVDGLIRGGKAIAVLHATDGSEDGLRKVSQAVHAAQSGENSGMEGSGRRARVKIWRIFSSTQLNMALGATNVIHAALIDGGAARNFAIRAAKLSNYREMEPS
jgi:hypothetical protein